MNMYEKTLVFARKDKRTARVIAEDAGVNRWWFAKFRQGKAPNPTLENLERLYDYYVSRSSRAKPGKPNGRPARPQPAGRSTH